MMSAFKGVRYPEQPEGHLRADQLPEGSVVAGRYYVVMAIRPPGDENRWDFHYGVLPDSAADELLAMDGGQVLRHGYPKESEK